jgi:hypothetical protein
MRARTSALSSQPRWTRVAWRTSPPMLRDEALGAEAARGPVREEVMPRGNRVLAMIHCSESAARKQRVRCCLTPFSPQVRRMIG